MSLPTVPLNRFRYDADADRLVAGLVSRRSIRLSTPDGDQVWGPDHSRPFAMNEQFPPSCGMLPEDWDMLFAAMTERLRGTASGIDIQSVRAALEECVQDLSMLQAALEPGLQHRKHLELETVMQQARSELAALPVSKRDGPTAVLDSSGSTGVRGRVETL